LPQSDSLTVGENSDVCYKGVPEKYMTVYYADDAYSYKINNTDSCLYYKINNENPNAHTFTVASAISAFGITKSGKEIIDVLKKLDNEYYMLSEVWEKLDTTWKRSANYLSIEQGERIFNSFIHKEKYRGWKIWKWNTTYKLGILDKYTKINNTGYCYTDTLPKEQKDFKIQFFKMNNWSTKKQEKGFWDHAMFWKWKTYFSDSIRSYYAKPMQIFTEWGAGHIKVTRKDDHFSVTFPKAITTTIPTEKIQETAKKSETGVYLKQMLKSYPMPTDFYIPVFSNALSEYVCELTKIDTLIFQTKNSRESDTLAISGSFVPKIETKNQNLVTGGIEYKARILNKAFYWSKHWLLAVVWLFLSTILFFSFPKSGTDKIKNARWYVLCLFTLFWFFLNQKLLIAEKLTFTYPYFEKIYPVSYLTTLFSLFALFLLIILVNQAYFKVSGNIQKGNFVRLKIPVKLKFLKKWNDKKVVDYDNLLCRIIISLVILITCFVAFYGIKKNFILPIWDSYTTGEVSGFWKIWRWQKMVVLNDNHFTVFMIVSVLLAVLLALFVMPKKRLNFFNKFNFEKIIEWILNKKIAWFCFIAFIVICFFVLRGNFATAFAVLILLYVLSSMMKILTDRIPTINDRWNILKNWEAKFPNKFEWSLTWFKYNLIKHKLWLWIIGTLALCCACVGIGLSDFGFFINVFGIGITWIILIFCSFNYKDIDGDINSKILNTNFIAGFVLGVVFLILGGLLVFNNKTNPENIDYERSTRRIQNCLDPDKVREAGYLYTESDMQWMQAMRYYAEKVETGRGKNYDIYGEDNNFHQLIASGQSPVILNDVCVPGVYLGSLHGYGWLGLLIGVVVLGFLVYWFSIGDCWRNADLKGTQKPFKITQRSIGRLLAGNLWIGVTLYLLLSYYWLVPFTGRLIPGFGVDAVGEALEIIVLFAFMCALDNPSNK
jgi:hypothetical protein